MPFWKKKPPDPEVEAARAVAEASLPSGWRIDFSDLESYRFPGGSLRTYGIFAVGPAGEASLVVGAGEPAAFRETARYMRGELEVTESWSPEVAASFQGRTPAGFEPRNREDAAAQAAAREVAAALPPGWVLASSDRERYRFVGGSVDAYGVSAVGPSGEVVLAVALDEVTALRAVLRRVNGEPPSETGWAPPIQRGP